ncbi:S8 family serine peptidase [Thiomicrorhabdus heinhorstiae]|uniref:S8 family serine peptidase n=1 Tax=Thiomicrorhabdus heinhorstiae TaxID=2748010 RepID=A0ABS0BVY0_9GAMM|nr:S8 family serine peptidase [Thiomicrorhabdus heinhorstiae]MBF6057967.1 S8 family serine peptidase [Thiomicrorhabdus heinhorstiae]
MSLKLQNKWLILAVSGLLSACGGGGGDSTDNTDDPNPDIDVSVINDPLIDYQWYLYNYGQAALVYDGTGGTPGADINVFDADGLYAGGFSGQGVEVAVVDSGLEIGHEDLQANVVANGSYNFLYGTNGLSQFDPSPTSDDGDHGTSVGGLLGARGGNSLGIWGVAPYVKLKGFNFIASQTFISEELGALGYEPVRTDYYPELSSNTVSVFNRSYGTNPDIVIAYEQEVYYDYVMDALEWGAKNLRNGKGAIYVKAAGNEFEGGSVFSQSTCSDAIDSDITCFNVNMEPEATLPYQIVVGAFNPQDERSSYSSTGSAIWISAPGGEYGIYDPAILATDVAGCDRGYSMTANINENDFDRGLTSENSQCNYYSRFGGTSAATPIASGVAALMLEANPDLSWRDLKHILASTARQLDPTLAARTIVKSGQTVTLENGWVTNAAGYHFSNAYGFGAVNAIEAVKMSEDWAQNQTHLAAQQTLTSGDLTVAGDNAIPDNSPLGLSQSYVANGNLNIESVKVTLSIEGMDSNEDGSGSHNINAADYQITLESPSGTRSILLTPYNAYQANYDMKGLRLISHAFYGETVQTVDPQAGWTLTVKDLKSGTVSGLGKLTGWSLEFYGTSI